MYRLARACVNKELLAQWETVLTVEGAHVLELHPDEKTMTAMTKYVADYPATFSAEN